MIGPIPKPTPRVKVRKPLRSRPHVIDWRIRQEVTIRDEGTCQWCGVPGGALDCHHRLPRSRGGRDTLECLVSVHRQCHTAIHTTHITEAYEQKFLVHSADELAGGWR